MTRRDFLLASASSVTARGAVPERPNVLFLSVDDMNDWVGCLRGYPGVKTPNIDRLARRGVLFTDAHCSSPLCNPSRTALFTGLRASTTGVYNNEHWWRPALPNVVTLPQYLRKHGYHVAGAGKVFHHNAGYNPPDQWDEFQMQVFDDPWYRRPEWYPWVKKIPAPPGHPFNGLSGMQGEFDWGVIPGRPESEYGDMAAVKFASEFFQRKHTKPFFLACGLWHPHIPLFAPQNYFDLYPEKDVRTPKVKDGDLGDVPPIAQKWAAVRREEYDRIMREGKWREAVRAYLAAISFADAMVGRVLDALDNSAYGKNTVIVFWSDNGWHLGEKEHWHKSTLWQRSTHVPLIVAGPGMKENGRPRSQPVTLLDLYPTVLEMCGLPAKGDLDGKSLAPLLRDSRAPRDPAVITFLAGNHAVKTDKWRYIRYHDGTEELYDQVTDADEFDNLALQPKYAKIKQELSKWTPKMSAKPVPERKDYDFEFTTHTWRLRSQ